MKPFANIIKIAHLTPTFFAKNSVIGGGERYVFNISNALEHASRILQRPISQTIISVGDSDQELLNDKLRIRILKNSSPFHTNMDGISNRLWAELDDIDIVHVHQSLTWFGAFAVAIASSKRIPIVSTDLGGGNNELMLGGKGLELCDGVLSISKYAKSLIASNYSGLHEVVIGPVDTDFFCLPPSSAIRDRRLGLCVSRILPHKGIDRIIQALPDAMRLVVVGQAYDSRYLELLQEMARDKDVQFIHDADDSKLVDLYHSAGLFLQGSTHKDVFGNVIQKPELMGLTTLEAMACGLPAIVSDAGSLPEMVRDDRFGKAFSNEHELKSLLEKYLRGDWPEMNHSQLAREYVLDNFSFLSVGQSVLQFYENVREAKLRSTAANV